MKLFILCICVLGLTIWVSPNDLGQDISAEELLDNLKTEHYSGKPIDLDLEEVGIETLISYLEKFSGLSFELSGDFPSPFTVSFVNAYPQILTKEDITVYRDIVYTIADGHELKLDIAVPKYLKAPVPAVVDIPGGSWRVVEKSVEDALFYAKHGFIGVSITHRTSDIAIFPAAVHDCKTAIRWLRAHAREYNIDPDNIGVTGFSSGGHLAALVGTSVGDTFLEGKGDYLDYSSSVQEISHGQLEKTIILVPVSPRRIILALMDFNGIALPGDVLVLCNPCFQFAQVFYGLPTRIFETTDMGSDPFFEPHVGAEDLSSLDEEFEYVCQFMPGRVNGIIVPMADNILRSDRDDKSAPVGPGYIFRVGPVYVNFDFGAPRGINKIGDCMKIEPMVHQ